jgi:hypothetical protein
MNAAVAFQSFVQLFPCTPSTLIFFSYLSSSVGNYEKNKILQRGMIAVLSLLSVLETCSEMLQGWYFFFSKWHKERN